MHGGERIKESHISLKINRGERRTRIGVSPMEMVIDEQPHEHNRKYETEARDAIVNLGHLAIKKLFI